MCAALTLHDTYAKRLSITCNEWGNIYHNGGGHSRTRGRQAMDEARFIEDTFRKNLTKGSAPSQPGGPSLGLGLASIIAFSRKKRKNCHAFWRGISNL